MLCCRLLELPKGLNDFGIRDKSGRGNVEGERNETRISLISRGMNTIARFNCPGCQRPIEAAAGILRHGVECPDCKTLFVPEQFETFEEEEPDGTGKNLPVGKVKPKVETAEDREEREERKRVEWNAAIVREVARLNTMAGNFKLWGFIAIGISIVAALITAANNENADHADLTGYVISGALWSLGIIFVFLSQLVYIRAGLEKLNSK